MIRYVVGDATAPQGVGKRVIVHCCNDAGGWGSGFVLALSRRWKEPEENYRAWAIEGSDFKLGAVQMVEVEPELWVANLIGQHGYGKPSDPGFPFVRYDALEAGFQGIAGWAALQGATIHMPRVGCGLAGGDWVAVEQLVWDTFGVSNVEVTVYDLPEAT